MLYVPALDALSREEGEIDIVKLRSILASVDQEASILHDNIVAAVSPLHADYLSATNDIADFRKEVDIISESVQELCNRLENNSTAISQYGESIKSRDDTIERINTINKVLQYLQRLCDIKNLLFSFNDNMNNLLLAEAASDVKDMSAVLEWIVLNKGDGMCCELLFALETDVALSRTRLLSFLDEMLGRYIEIRPGFLAIRHNVSPQATKSLHSNQSNSSNKQSTHSALKNSFLPFSNSKQGHSNISSNSNNALSNAAHPTNRAGMVDGCGSVSLSTIWSCLSIVDCLNSKIMLLSSLLIKFYLDPSFNRCMKAATCPPVRVIMGDTRGAPATNREKQAPEATPSLVYCSTYIKSVFKKLEDISLLTISVDTKPLSNSVDGKAPLAITNASHPTGEKASGETSGGDYLSLLENFIDIVQNLMRFLNENMEEGLESILTKLFSPIWIYFNNFLFSHSFFINRMDDTWMERLVALELEAKSMNLLPTDNTLLTQNFSKTSSQRDGKKMDQDLHFIRQQILTIDNFNVINLTDEEIRGSFSNQLRSSNPSAAAAAALQQQSHTSSNITDDAFAALDILLTESNNYFDFDDFYSSLGNASGSGNEGSGASNENSGTGGGNTGGSGAGSGSGNTHSNAQHTGVSGSGSGKINQDKLMSILEVLKHNTIKLPAITCTSVAKKISNSILSNVVLAIEKDKGDLLEGSVSRLFFIRQIFNLWLLMRPTTLHNISRSDASDSRVVNKSLDGQTENEESKYLAIALYYSDCVLLSYCAMILSWLIAPKVRETVRSLSLFPDIIVSLRESSRVEFAKMILQQKNAILYRGADILLDGIEDHQVLAVFEESTNSRIIKLKKIFTCWSGVLPSDFYYDSAVYLLDHFLLNLLELILSSQQNTAGDISSLRDVCENIYNQLLPILSIQSSKINNPMRSSNPFLLKLKNWSAFKLLQELIDAEWCVILDRKKQFLSFFDPQQRRKILSFNSSLQLSVDEALEQILL